MTAVLRRNMRDIIVHQNNAPPEHVPKSQIGRKEPSQSRQGAFPCDDGDVDAVAAAAAAAFASLSTLSASLMCGVDGPGMPRKWVLSDDLRLGVAGEEDQAPALGEVD